MVFEIVFFDAIASPSTYPPDWVSQSVMFSDFGDSYRIYQACELVTLIIYLDTTNSLQKIYPTLHSSSKIQLIFIIVDSIDGQFVIECYQEHSLRCRFLRLGRSDDDNFIYQE